VWPVCTDDCVGALLEVTAWGETSGLVAKAQFTDGNISSVGVSAQSPNPVIRGNSATYTVTVNFAGNGTGCSATLTATGLPAGASVLGGNPFASLTGSGTAGNDVKTATLTIATTAATPFGTNSFTVTATHSANCQNASDASTTGKLIVVGPPNQVQVETAADGSGTVVPAQNLATGSSLTAYAIERDSGNRFVTNAPATWSLVNTTGWVQNSDLAPVGGNPSKSAVFTANSGG